MTHTTGELSNTHLDDWMNRAGCIDEEPTTFFPSTAKGVEIAKNICRLCIVQEECLEYALTHNIDHGVWGGESERSRRRIKKRRKNNR